MKRFIALNLILLFLFVTIRYPRQNQSHAQEETTCSAITEAAIRSTRQVCTGLSRGNACYGNTFIDAQPQPGLTDFRFETPGDMSRVANFQSIQLGSLNEMEKQWGIVRMELQASLPRTAPESVSVVLFGSVSLENAGFDGEPVEVVLDKRFGRDLRAKPGYSSDIVYTAAVGDYLLAYERSEDGRWLRVEVPTTGQTAWASAASVVSETDLKMLPVATSDSFYQPMQAVYLSRNNSGETTCADFPTDGMLIQTPEGIAEVTLLINEVTIELGSTAFFEITPARGMTISLLEGHSTVTSHGVRRELPVGFSTSISLDENLSPTSAPSPIVAIDPSLNNLLTNGPGSLFTTRWTTGGRTVQSEPTPQLTSEERPQSPPVGNFAPSNQPGVDIDGDGDIDEDDVPNMVDIDGDGDVDDDEVIEDGSAEGQGDGETSEIPGS